MSDALRHALMQGEQAGARYALLPPRLAAHGIAGTQLANRAGSSIEFMDHREYRPGDDVRRIDWAAYARSDRLTIRLYREEVSPHLDVLIDGSRSMDLEGTAKAAGAAALAAAFATAADNAHFTHAAWLAADGCRPLLSGKERPTAWQGIEFATAQPLTDSLHQMPPRWRRQGVRLLISDLLWPADPLPALQRLADGAASLIVAQVLAQQDVTPPARGNMRLADSETGELREIFIDAAAQQRYRDALTRHQSAWAQACRQVGAVFVTLVAESLLDQWNLTDLVAAEVLRVA